MGTERVKSGSEVASSSPSRERPDGGNYFPPLSCLGRGSTSVRQSMIGPCRDNENAKIHRLLQKDLNVHLVVSN